MGAAAGTANAGMIGKDDPIPPSGDEVRNPCSVGNHYAHPSAVADTMAVKRWGACKQSGRGRTIGLQMRVLDTNHVAQGNHPFPSRTRKLSTAAPMVLPLDGGRAGRCHSSFLDKRSRKGGNQGPAEIHYLAGFVNGLLRLFPGVPLGRN